MADHDRDDEKPLDPAAERLRAKMTRLLLVSGGIMVVGLIAVFFAIVYRLGFLGPGQDSWADAGGAPLESRIEVPPGARLVSTALDGNRALLGIQAAGVISLLLVELPSGRVVGRYALEPN